MKFKLIKNKTDSCIYEVATANKNGRLCVWGMVHCDFIYDAEIATDGDPDEIDIECDELQNGALQHQKELLLEMLKKMYLKYHHGSQELDEMIGDVFCKVMGDDKYQEWVSDRKFEEDKRG